MDADKSIAATRWHHKEGRSSQLQNLLVWRCMTARIRSTAAAAACGPGAIQPQEETRTSRHSGASPRSSLWKRRDLATRPFPAEGRYLVASPQLAGVEKKKKRRNARGWLQRSIRPEDLLTLKLRRCSRWVIRAHLLVRVRGSERANFSAMCWRSVDPDGGLERAVGVAWSLTGCPARSLR